MATRKSSADVKIGAAHIAGIARSLDVLGDGVNALNQDLQDVGRTQAAINAKLENVEQSQKVLQSTISGTEGVLTRLAVVESQLASLKQGRRDEKEDQKGRREYGVAFWSAVVATLALIATLVFGVVPNCQVRPTGSKTTLAPER